MEPAIRPFPGGLRKASVQSYPAPGGGKWQASTDGGRSARWRRDGREIFYIAPDGRLMAAPVTLGPTFNLGTPVALFDAHMLGGINPPAGLRQQYDVAPDGQRFLLNVPIEDEDSALTVLQNWGAGLKK